MSFLKELFKKEKVLSEIDLGDIRSKFTNFLSILENNHLALKTMSDMEEKSLGEYVFDINYLNDSIESIRFNIIKIIENLIDLGGDKYSGLSDTFAKISSDIDHLIYNRDKIEEDSFTVKLQDLDKDQFYRVGSKNANLGEISSKLGINVPRGFAITVWSYIKFISENDIQYKINEKIKSVDISHYDELLKVSDEIRQIIIKSPLPIELSDEILRSYKELNEINPKGFVAVRSSALGEDTGLSFAGQYATYLGIKEKELLSAYKKVLASKFTPKAIYYFLSHSLEERDLAMSVGCVEMIDAKSSGVIYTRSPINPDDDYIIVNSIYGLGKYLVDGILNPDIFIVPRNPNELTEQIVACKNCRLILDNDGSLIDEDVPEDKQYEISLEPDELKKLVEIAQKLEDHYDQPLDIEWSIDQSGEPVIMQVRPLRILQKHYPIDIIDFSDIKKFHEGGTTVCPGADSGKIFHVNSPNDIPDIPDASVIVTPRPFPGLITAMENAKALITHFGGLASHMATIAREYRLPTISGIEDIDQFENGQLVTVDATNRVIYDGHRGKVIEAFCLDRDFDDDDPNLTKLRLALKKISPLKLLNPNDEHFNIAGITTFHDITRYSHQKAMEEMFRDFYNIHNESKTYIQLKTNLPLEVDLIYIDRKVELYEGVNYIEENDIRSYPMQSFWDGVIEQGWPRRLQNEGNTRLNSNSSTRRSDESNRDFSQRSFVILSQDFMILSLKMGYHFSTIEALCTEVPSKNYIKLLFKDGGATLERRERRIRLLTNLLDRMGFENLPTGDFLESRITYESKKEILSKLKLLGKVSLMIKQLDMVLSNDSITDWYTKDFIKRLNLKESKKNSKNKSENDS